MQNDTTPDGQRCETCEHFRVRKSHQIGECLWVPAEKSPVWLDRHPAEMYRTEGAQCEAWKEQSA